jgi:hypothetical protein
VTDEVPLLLSDDEAKQLYRHLHRVPGGQDQFCETYRQLQNHFFQNLTVDELTVLLDGEA